MPPAKLACKGCRLSKVKCDIEAVDSGRCSRCARLGLLCLPTGPSKRGRPHTARDISRLGPAVRMLLQSGNEEDSDEDELPSDSAKLVKRDNSQNAVRTQGARVMVSQLTTQSSRWCWQRHILYVVQRSQDLESMAIAMLTAAQLGFKMEEVQAAFALVDPSVQPADEPMPDFLDEWYQPDMISLTRFQNCGNTDYRASSAFEGIFGVGTMQQGMISVLDRQSDRDEVVELTGKLWAQVTAEADVTQYAQAEGERGAVTFTIAGRAHGPFKMRGRLVVRELSLRTWTCLNFLPAPEQRSLTAPAGGFVASVSLQSSPLPSPTLPHSLQPSLLPAPPPAAAAAASAEPTRAGESAAPGPEQVLTPLTAAAAEDGINDSMGVFNASELVALFMDEGEVDALFNGGVPLGEADGSALTLLGVLGRR